MLNFDFSVKHNIITYFFPYHYHLIQAHCVVYYQYFLGDANLIL